MSTDGTTFATRLQEHREKAGLSQYALAKRSGLSKQAISRLEMGEREPSWDTVQRLAAALGVDCRTFANPSLAEEVQAIADEPPPPRGRPPKASPPEPPEKPKRKRRGEG
jgi:transcriptional regulator with XRE-family HTH domain